jgi:hypothetical protein
MSRYPDLRKFATSLRDLTDGLPTEEEKTALSRQFEEVVAFLSQTRNALESLPTKEETDGVRKTILAFEELATKVNDNPILAAALGQPQPRASRRKTALLSELETAKAQALVKELESLSIDEMSIRLQDAGIVSTRELNAAAAVLGIKTTRKTTRDSLVHQVVTRISNFRGYQELQGRTAE